jgi:zinc/manganese transport system substrate-binding protein
LNGLGSRAALSLSLVLAVLPAHADIKVFACEPEWAALAEEIGGEEVSAYSATHALQDPHYIQARPSLIAKVRNSDLVICSGADLEIGWLPALLQKANNRKVVPGSDGYMEASQYVLRLGATGSSDRSQGDIHPAGNPHIQTNPHNVLAVATALARRMAELDSASAALYEQRFDDFSNRWRSAIDRWETLAESLRGKRVITHHNSWVYLEDWLGLAVVANLESVPGLPPTATHLSLLTKEFAGQGADLIVRSPYQDDRASLWLSDRTGIPAVVLPLTVGGSDEAVDLFGLFDSILQRMLKTAL